MHYVLGYRIPLVSPSLNQLYFCICCQVACFICFPLSPFPPPPFPAYVLPFPPPLPLLSLFHAAQMPVAIKMIELNEVGTLIREYQSLVKIRHPHVINMYGLSIDNQPMLVRQARWKGRIRRNTKGVLRWRLYTVA